ncbi:unnamed protein product [Leuciscus chuanchicus]
MRATAESDKSALSSREFFDIRQHDIRARHTSRGDHRLKLKTKLRKKFQHLHEGITKHGNPQLLNEIYTELYITEGREFNDEYEIRQIETAAKRAATADTPINRNYIFKPLPGQNQPIRTVLTKGFAGIGKTVSVQKFILDWAEGNVNQDIYLIFPLPFRELNLKKDKLSLSDLLQVFPPETMEIDIFSDKYKVLFIFDGLDECRFHLNFHSNETLHDATKETSVDVLLTNLILGNLLPSALIWITSRPAASDLIPSECVHRVTEVRGFNDPHKEEYFRKRITDQSLANKIISHLKSSRSLYIMCHIPVFCWISATVLEKMLSGAESGEIPKTLTQMYTHFLILQTNIKHEKDYEKKLTDEDMILKLGKLAFQELMKGNVIFYEEDLRECGIDMTEASVYSGLCTQIFREELRDCGITEEGCAALASALTLNPSHLRELDLTRNNVQDLGAKRLFATLKNPECQLKVLKLKECGLADEGCAALVSALRSNPSHMKELDLSENKLGDSGIKFLANGPKCPFGLEELWVTGCGITHEGCAALASALTSNLSQLKELNLSSNVIGDSGLKLLSIALENPHCKLETLGLKDCGVRDEGCAALISALTANPSHLSKLHLSGNEIGTSTKEQLSALLALPDNKLKKVK